MSATNDFISSSSEEVPTSVSSKVGVSEPLQEEQPEERSHAVGNNDTIDTLLNRRSIRRFEPTPIPKETTDLIERAAQRAASSQFLNAWSAVRITDPTIKAELAAIGNQTYIAEAPLLYVFILDQRRNAAIAAKQGIDITSEDLSLRASYRFIQAQNDAVLALHAMETAAESLGLGCVILGSVLNDLDRLITLLHLPQFTFPVLGLALGKPAQKPSLKPRMPRSMQFFDNQYPSDFNDPGFDQSLKDFDSTVHQYYDLRQADRPVDAFSAQIKRIASTQPSKLNDIMTFAPKQGFDVTPREQ
ncbi:nitroreductase family protein [Bifidobacterium aquikefiricola]|uniref:Nitroreductase family protein n=1 Tax=Bifidobacterium aquikefiricola TaxID=3059038 RepID=A0AB39U6I2_9BIFI